MPSSPVVWPKCLPIQRMVPPVMSVLWRENLGTEMRARPLRVVLQGSRTPISMSFEGRPEMPLASQLLQVVTKGHTV